MREKRCFFIFFLQNEKWERERKATSVTILTSNISTPHKSAQEIHLKLFFFCTSVSILRIRICAQAKGSCHEAFPLCGYGVFLWLSLRFIIIIEKWARWVKFVIGNFIFSLLQSRLWLIDCRVISQTLFCVTTWLYVYFDDALKRKAWFARRSLDGSLPIDGFMPCHHQWIFNRPFCIFVFQRFWYWHAIHSVCRSTAFQHH